MGYKNSGKKMATKKVTTKAPKIEDEQFNDYEMVMIISPEITGEALDTTDLIVTIRRRIRL